jgi:hypothetical protein
MAKTIARCTGQDSSRVKVVHRLGSVSATASADTRHTFAKAYVRADGSGFVEVRRDGVVLHRYEFGREHG